MDAASELEPLFEREQAWPLVRSHVDRTAPSRAARKSADGEPFDSELAKKNWLISVAASANAELTSGIHHIYRGKVSGFGQSLGEIHHKALIELYRRKMISEDFLDQRLEEIVDIVQSRG